MPLLAERVRASRLKKKQNTSEAEQGEFKRRENQRRKLSKEVHAFMRDSCEQAQHES